MIQKFMQKHAMEEENFSAKKNKFQKLYKNVPLYSLKYPHKFL